MDNNNYPENDGVGNGNLIMNNNKKSASTCWKIMRVPIYSILTVVAAALQAVSFKKAGYSLKRFPYVILLVVAFSFIPILFTFVFYIDRAYGILKESKTYEIKKTFAVLGFLNAANGVLIIFSNPHVSGIVQSALAQAVIPMTLILSVLYLKASYNKFQYFGAFVVFVGIFIEFIPYLTAIENKLPHEKHNSKVTSIPFFVITFCLGQLPASFSGVYQENAFSKARVNVVYMMAYSSLAQFVCLILFAPVNFIPIFGGGTTPEEFIEMIKDAFLCITNNYDGHPECQHAGLILLCCIVSMLLTQIFQTLLVKVSSAATSVLVMTLITPVSSIAFTFQFLMGEYVETISVVQAMALVVLLIGIALYRFADVIVLRLTSKSINGKKSMDMNTSPYKEHPAVEHFPAIRQLEEAEAMRQQAIRDSIPTPTSSRTRTSSKPILLPTRCGIINSEYTAGGFNAVDDWEGNIFIEATEYEFSHLDSRPHSLEEKGITPLLYGQHDNMLSRSFDV